MYQNHHNETYSSKMRKVCLYQKEILLVKKPNRTLSTKHQQNCRRLKKQGYTIKYKIKVKLARMTRRLPF